MLLLFPSVLENFPLITAIILCVIHLNIFLLVGKKIPTIHMIINRDFMKIYNRFYEKITYIIKIKKLQKKRSIDLFS